MLSSIKNQQINNWFTSISSSGKTFIILAFQCLIITERKNKILNEMTSLLLLEVRLLILWKINIKQLPNYDFRIPSQNLMLFWHSLGRGIIYVFKLEIILVTKKTTRHHWLTIITFKIYILSFSNHIPISGQFSRMWPAVITSRTVMITSPLCICFFAFIRMIFYEKILIMHVDHFLHLNVLEMN